VKYFLPRSSAEGGWYGVKETKGQADGAEVKAVVESLL